VTLSGVRAYPSGFALSIIATLRDGHMRGDPFGMHIHFRSPEAGQHEPPPDVLRVNIAYPDGTTTSLGERVHPPEGERPRLYARSQRGGGTERRYVGDFWIAPLPSVGDISFMTEWVNEGIDLTRVDIEGQLIRDAAQRAERLWD
jgi:hypothetical protein